MFLQIDSAAVVAHTNRLEKLGKGALNRAVKNTLNSAAFDVKKTTMPVEAKRAFVERKANFFKVMSKVVPAKGGNVSTMEAVVGFVPPAKDPGHAVEDLRQQEQGGSIADRSFIPLRGARAGKNEKRLVRAEMRLSYIMSRQSVKTRSSIADALENAKGRNKKEKFVRTAIAAGKGGFVIGTERERGSRVLLRINSVVRKGADTVVNSTPIYSVRAHRSVGVERTNFMRKASTLSAAKMEGFYVGHAKRELRKEGWKG